MQQDISAGREFFHSFNPGFRLEIYSQRLLAAITVVKETGDTILLSTQGTHLVAAHRRLDLDNISALSAHGLCCQRAGNHIRKFYDF